MNIINKQDSNLESFFESHRENIQDDGFTKKTMNKLPQAKPFMNKKELLIHLVLLIGAVFTLPFIGLFKTMYVSLNFYTLLFLIFCFAGFAFSIIVASDPEYEFV